MENTSENNSAVSPRIIIESNPSKSRLANLGIKSWPKYACPPGKYKLKFDAEETSYYVRGKIKAYPNGSKNYVEFGVGDLVIIPKGFNGIWEVLVTIDKYYMFEPSSQ